MATAKQKKLLEMRDEILMEIGVKAALITNIEEEIKELQERADGIVDEMFRNPTPRKKAQASPEDVPEEKAEPVERQEVPTEEKTEPDPAAGLSETDKLQEEPATTSWPDSLKDII